MNINSAFPSDYLKASDIPPGRRATVTIEGVNIVEVGRNKDKRPVVYFKGKEKGLVLNITNANMITDIAKSDETDDWVGVQIAIYSTKVDYQGRRVDALRVDYPAGHVNNGQKRVTPQAVSPRLEKVPPGEVLPPEAYDPDPDDTIPF